MTDRLDILRRMEDSPYRDEVDNRAREWVGGEDSRLLSKTSNQTTVYEALHLWRLRMGSVARAGHVLYGAPSFLARLEKLTPQKKLDQFAIAGLRWTGSVFFEHTSGNFIGFVMVAVRSTPKKSELSKQHPVLAVQ